MPVLNIKEVIRQVSKITEEEALNQLYNAIKYEFREITKNTIKKSLREHPTYLAISAGLYNAHFGFYPDTGENRVKKIVDTIIDTLDIELERNRNLIQFVAIPNYEEIYKLREAKVDNDSSNSRKGITAESLDWLEWLLEAGSRVVIREYQISFDPKHGINSSRSGEAVMIKGGTWSVPQAIAGTISDNWITQSLDIAEKELSPILKRFISYKMK